MARRNQNLAGLAALGALGYALTRGGNKAPVEDRVGEDVVRSAAEPEVDYGPDFEREVSRGSRGPVAIGAQSSGRASASAGPAMMSRAEEDRIRAAGGPRGRTGPAMMSRDEEARIRATGGPRGTRYSPTDTGDETARLARRYPNTGGSRDLSIPPPATSKYEPPSGNPTPRRGTGMLESIKDYYASPSSLEGVKRNISNTLNATAGLSAPGFVGRETAKQFGARSAARRAEEGLSDAEVGDLMRRRALSEADTTGGAVGYKKGGKVKAKKMVVTKMGGKVSSASKRADGIATKGKTRGKLY